MSDEPINPWAGYAPNEGQAEAHASPARMKVLRWGRRYGKTVFIPYELMKVYREALAIPVSAQTEPPFHAWIIAPTYLQGRQVWRELVRFVPRKLIKGWEDNYKNPIGLHHKEMWMELLGNRLRPEGLVEVKTAVDPEALQTSGLDFLAISESQDITDEAFERVMPTVNSPYRLGRVVVEGIPPTYPDHWSQRLWLTIGRQMEMGDQNVFRSHRTSFQNPHLTDKQLKEIDAARWYMRDASWRRFYLAEFSAGSGYFTRVEECISGYEMEGPVGVMSDRYVAGLDIGRRMDPTVMVVMDRRKRQVVHCYEWPIGQSWLLIRAGVTRVAQEWAVERLVMDTTGIGDVFAEELHGEGLPIEECYIDASRRANLLEGLAVAIEKGTVHYPKQERLLRQLWAFQPVRERGGRWKISAPPGEHDDYVFALAMALSACDIPEEERYLGYGARREKRYVPTQAELDGYSGSPTWDRWKKRRRAIVEATMIEQLEKMGIKV